jgi:predicted  nucleic acid-binding Zn-ribbon protein
MVIDWEEIERMPPEDIENIRVEVLKELQTLEDSMQIVKDEYDQKSKEMIALEGEKKDLSISLSKAKHSIRKKRNEIEILQTKFWQKRR